MKDFDNDTIKSSELVEQAFDYWFSDHNHVRSPFPNYIHSQVKAKSTEQFLSWIHQLNPKAKDEVNDTVIAEKFEEIIFETAIDLVKTENERITILYPFLPRTGDKFQDEVGSNLKSNSIVIDRQIVKEGDVSYLKIVLENKTTKEKWETKFELPV